MGFFGNWIAATATEFQAYDPATTEAVAKTLGEPVLASGPVNPASETLAYATNQVIFQCILALGLATMVLSAAYLVRRRMKDGSYKGFANTLPGIGAMAVVVGMVGALSSNERGTTEHQRAYIITASRIVILNEKGRIDVPATAVTSVTRSLEGMIEIGGARGAIVAITPETEARADLDKAVERMASSSMPNRFLSETVTR